MLCSRKERFFLYQRFRNINLNLFEPKRLSAEVLVSQLNRICSYIKSQLICNIDLKVSNKSVHVANFVKTIYPMKYGDFLYPDLDIYVPKWLTVVPPKRLNLRNITQPFQG